MNTHEAPGDLDVLVTTEEAARLLSSHPATLATWRHERRGPAYVKGPGRTVRYRRRDLLTWIESNTIVPE